MKSILAFLFAAGVCLGGCSQVQKAEDALDGTTISSAQVQTAVNAFDGLELAAENYIAYCTQPKLPAGCSVAGLTKLHDAVIAGRAARDNLEAFAAKNSGAGGDITTLYNALTAATGTLDQIEAQYGVQKQPAAK